MNIFLCCSTVIRLIIFSSLLLSFIYHQKCDEYIQLLWDHIRTIPYLELRSFEAFFSGVIFIIFFVQYRIMDKYCTILHKFRFNHGLDIDTKETYFATKVGIAYLLILYPLDFFLQPRFIPISGPSWIEFLSHLVFGVFLYDFLFFFIHLAMHTFPSLKRLHVKHHIWNKTVRTRETLRLSFTDASLQVLTNIFVQNLFNKHPMTRLAHNFWVIYLLCEIHSGYDLPWFSQNVIPFGICGGSVRHNIHHMTGDRYYQQFFTYLDDYFPIGGNAKLGTDA